MGTPYAARAIIIFAANNRVTQNPFCRVVVHGHLRTTNKHAEPVPVVAHAAQNLVLGHMQGRLLPMHLPTSLHLAQLGLQIGLALDKSRRLMRERHRLIPHLKASGIEAIESTDILHPIPHPMCKLWPTARGLEKVPLHMRPTKG